MTTTHATPPIKRRTFLTTIAGVFGAALSLVAGIPVLRFLLDPLFSKPKDAGFVRLAPLSSIPKNKPAIKAVIARRTDSYTAYPPAPIGRVWVVRGDKELAPEEIRCFQSICPHLGCGIEHETGQGFHCPCHVSNFSLDGSRQLGPSPRGMDELECRLTPEDQSGEQWIEVKYAEYRTGTTDKQTIA